MQINSFALIWVWWKNFLYLLEVDGEDGDGAPRKRKVKNRILHLTELMPNATFQLVAQYGTSDQPIYVMEIEIHGQVMI